MPQYTFTHHFTPPPEAEQVVEYIATNYPAYAINGVSVWPDRLVIDVTQTLGQAALDVVQVKINSLVPDPAYVAKKRDTFNNSLLTRFDASPNTVAGMRPWIRGILEYLLTQKPLE